MSELIVKNYTLIKSSAMSYCCFKKSKARSSTGRVYAQIFPTRDFPIRQALRGCQSVLDIGCGTGDFMDDVNKSGFYAVGVDLFKPYLHISKERKTHNAFVMGDIETLEFKPKSFDAVMAIDIIEHLEKDKGAILIEKMKKWARKRVLLITPNGYVAQQEYDENPFQIHKSGWTAKEMKECGFKTYGIGGLYFLKGEKAEVRFKPKIIWEIFSEITQKITFRCPNAAFEILCVKTLTSEDL